MDGRPEVERFEKEGTPPCGVRSAQRTDPTYLAKRAAPRGILVSCDIQPGGIPN
jgi:hypothetical protein